MSEAQKEFDAATKELSTVQTMYNRVKAWYESLSDPSAEDEVIWLSTRSRLSTAAKRVHAARQKVVVEQIVRGAASSTNLSDSSGISSELSARMDSIFNKAVNAKVLSKKELREQQDNAEKRQNVITWIEHGAPQGYALVKLIDEQLEAGNMPEMFGEAMTQEKWDQFKKEHPLPAIGENEVPLVADLDEDIPALPPPFKSETRPVLDIDPDKLNGKES